MRETGRVKVRTNHCMLSFTSLEFVHLQVSKKLYVYVCKGWSQNLQAQKNQK
jgi:hypothetical protein